MKKIYDRPEIEVFLFNECKDIITISGDDIADKEIIFDWNASN